MFKSSYFIYFIILYWRTLHPLSNASKNEENGATVCELWPFENWV